MNNNYILIYFYFTPLAFAKFSKNSISKLKLSGD